MRLLTRRDYRAARPAPFDVPNGVGFLGVVVDEPRLVSVLSVAPGPPAPVLLPDGPRPLLPVDAIARCFDYVDARPTRIDVVTRTLASWGDGPAARAYRSLLGPLDPASHRSVALVVHIDPELCGDAVALRGGGAAGTLRTALWCVRRVIAAAAPYARLQPLTAAALSADAAWTVDDAAHIVASLTPGGLDGSAPPIGGDGQVVGAAESGAPVALRLAGPLVDRVDIAAEPRLVRQTAVRLAALGVRGHVITDRPAQWRPLAEAIGDPLLFGVGPTVPPTAQVVIRDVGGPGDHRTDPGLTELRVHRRSADTSDGCFLLRQDLGDASLLHLVAPDGSPPTTVRTVSTPAERALTG
ncbi:type VII secretion protein EccE [Gordonia sp. (in: high G+C Gram-positive bacteria)]|uniref:type VII secretion protein EccE n=1 Tax=Gordonia sp. (in: high G+C Gram-positive bacteria) TaxID=84139 RepID=UPI003F97C4DD